MRHVYLQISVNHSHCLTYCISGKCLFSFWDDIYWQHFRESEPALLHESPFSMPTFWHAHLFTRPLSNTPTFWHAHFSTHPLLHAEKIHSSCIWMITWPNRGSIGPGLCWHVISVDRPLVCLLQPALNYVYSWYSYWIQGTTLLEGAQVMYYNTITYCINQKL